MASLLTLPGARGWLAVWTETAAENRACGANADAPLNGSHEDGRDGDGDTPVGLLMVQAVAEDADILTLGVLPGPWRRQGIAGRLLTHAKDGLLSEGVQRLILEVAEDNSGAIAFYHANGFTRIGLRRGYFTGAPDHPRDALVLARTLA